jgi:hypothetical protein
MAIATVVNVKGEVFAVNKDGVKRRLQKGDQLQEGEVLVTAPGSSAELDMGGGKIVNVAEQQTFAVDGAVGGPAQPNAATSALESAAAAQKVVQALASGDANALLEAEAAAAGLAGGADSGGSSFVQLLRISEGVTPVNYEFGSFAQGAVDQPTPGAIEELVETPPVNPPQILVGDGELFAESAESLAFEPALPGGSNMDGLGEFVQGQFKVSDPDGVASLVSVTINGVVILMADLVGSVIPGASGMLTITGFDPTTGIATFEYELTAVTTDVPDVDETDVFTFTTTDGTLVSNVATITITIVDDLPSISVSQGESPAQVVDDSDLGTNASGNFAGLFTSSFGADGAGSLSYALGFNAGGTGIVDTESGQNVVLSMNGGVVEGRTEGSNVLVFTVSVDGSGNVTLDQMRAVKHADTTNDNEPVALSAANLVTLTATITDGDGDVANAVANIGGAFLFLDDGPSLTVTANLEGASQLVSELDETEGADRGADADGNTDDAGPGLGQVTTAVQGGLTSLFALGGSFGADGAGTLSGVLSFVGFPGQGGLATTLSATDGGAITLFLESGVIVGRDQDGHQVLTIAIVGAPGSEQLQTTLFEALVHPNTATFDEAVQMLLGFGESEDEAPVIRLQYEVTRVDGDGDSVTQAAQIDLVSVETSAFSFDDDGPAVSDLNAGTIDENSGDTDLGVAATVLGIDGGLDGVKSVGIVANQVGGGTLAIVGGKLIYTAPASVDNSGGAVIATFTVTVTDNDDDTVTSTVTVNIGDANTPTLTVGNASGDETDGLVNTAGTLQFGFGGDGAGVLTLSAAGATWDGGSMTLTADNGDWTLTVNNDGTYSFQQNNAITHDNPLNHDEPFVITVTASVVDSDNSSTGNMNFTITVDDDGPSITSIPDVVMANQAQVVTGQIEYDAGTDGSGGFVLSSINDGGLAASITGIGSNFVTGLDAGGDPIYTVTVDADGQYHFELLQTSQEGEVTFNLTGVKAGGPVNSITFTDADDPSAMITFENAKAGGAVAKFNPSNGEFGVGSNLFNKDESWTSTFTGFLASAFTLAYEFNGSGTLTVHYTAFDSSGDTFAGSFDVSANGSTTVDFVAAGAFDGLVNHIDFNITGPANNSAKIKLTSFEAETVTPPDDQSIVVGVQLLDGDGDVTVTDTFTVDIVANDPDTNTVALNLTGGSGDDVIAGGFGNDILTGGAGDDIFQWTLGDQGTGGSPAVDIVVDFGNGTDKLDLKDLLQGEGAGNLTDYLHFTYNGITNSTTVNVSTHGDGVVDQQIVLAAVDITDAGALNDATIITNLLNQGKLVVDS